MNMNEFDGLLAPGKGIVIFLETPNSAGTIFFRNKDGASGDITIHNCADYQGGSPSWLLRDTITVTGHARGKDDLPKQAAYMKISVETECEFHLTTFSELNFVAHEVAEV